MYVAEYPGSYRVRRPFVAAAEPHLVRLNMAVMHVSGPPTGGRFLLGRILVLRGAAHNPTRRLRRTTDRTSSERGLLLAFESQVTPRQEAGLRDREDADTEPPPVSPLTCTLVRSLVPSYMLYRGFCRSVFLTA